MIRKKGILSELGRSMVEMLGVLAVIGVLSIVGIAGYKKAMNKIHANELMDLGMKVYHEAAARELMRPSANKDKAKLFLYSSSLSGSANQNIGWDRPSWTADTFNIMARAYKEYHVIIFYYMTEAKNGEQICAELAEMTQDSEQAHYRLLPGTQSDDVPGGVLVACNRGSSTTDGVAWW